MGIDGADEETEGVDGEREGIDPEFESEDSGRVIWLGGKRHGPEIRPFSVASTISSEGSVTGECKVDSGQDQ